MKLRNDWRAGYTEMCTSGSEGGSRKPDLEIDQGVGFLPNKSTFVENVGRYLASKGIGVLVIDGDRQGNCSTTLLGGHLKQGQPTLKDVIEGNAKLTEALYQARYQDLVSEDPDDESKNRYEEHRRERLYVVPSHPDLEKTSVFLAANRWAYDVLPDALAELKEPHIDIVLIDHAGSYTAVMEALLLASDGMFIPCQLEPYCVRGIFDMEAKLKQELRKHQIVNFGIVPYKVDWRLSLTQQYADELQQEFGDLVIHSVCTDANIPKAQSYFETIYEYKPRPTMQRFHSPSQDDFSALADDIIASLLMPHQEAK